MLRLLKKNIQTCKFFGEKKPTEQSIICQIIMLTYLGVTVNMLRWINIEGYHRIKAAGVLSVSVPVHGDSCWYS